MQQRKTPVCGYFGKKGETELLDQNGFDLWAKEYEESVRESEEEQRYPFAGYQRVIDAICRCVLEKGGQQVLDLGFGTGVLTQKLYDAGVQITGVDFSAEMIRIAQEKMPEAEFWQWDFTQGVPPELTGRTYDFIISTYAIHHLTQEQKLRLIGQLRGMLRENGRILFGDVMFETQEALSQCRETYAAEWDADESYLIMEELRASIGEAEFLKISDCAGICVIDGRKAKA